MDGMKKEIKVLKVLGVWIINDRCPNLINSKAKFDILFSYYFLLFLGWLAVKVKKNRDRT